MQLLFEDSDEGGRGLGLLAGPVRRLRARRIPHMGWNTLAVRRARRAARRPGRRRRLLRTQLRRRAGGRRRRPSRPSTTTARSSRPCESGALAGVQFHPERSGAAGARLLRERARMVKKRVIPCLDVAAGRVVKGVNFVDLRDVGDPIELATRYSELGADELVFLDITATVEGRGPDPRRDRALRRGAARSRSPSAAASPRWPTRGAAASRRRQGGRQPRRLRRPVHPHRARRRVRLAGGRVRDRRTCDGRGRHARRADTARA